MKLFYFTCLLILLPFVCVNVCADTCVNGKCNHYPNSDDELCEHLSDRHVIKFENGQKTTGRRSEPVNQMTYTGPRCYEKYMPSEITCRQTTWIKTDHENIEWVCAGKGMNGAQIKPGSVDISCERCLEVTDGRVLKGSCGITFEIDPPKPSPPQKRKASPTPQPIQKLPDSQGGSRHLSTIHKKWKIISDIAEKIVGIILLGAVFIICIRWIISILPSDNHTAVRHTRASTPAVHISNTTLGPRHTCPTCDTGFYRSSGYLVDDSTTYCCSRRCRSNYVVVDHRTSYNSGPRYRQPAQNVIHRNNYVVVDQHAPCEPDQVYQNSELSDSREADSLDQLSSNETTPVKATTSYREPDTTFVEATTSYREPDTTPVEATTSYREPDTTCVWDDFLSILSKPSPDLPVKATTTYREPNPTTNVTQTHWKPESTTVKTTTSYRESSTTSAPVKAKTSYR